MEQMKFEMGDLQQDAPKRVKRKAIPRGKLRALLLAVLLVLGLVALRVSNRCENAGSIDTGKLFDRFYRADPARTAGGFGIGLSIARSIAEGHRGAISARTEGDTITFTALLK